MLESNESSTSDSKDMSLVPNPLLKIFLEGLYDEGCNLSKLRGCPYIVMKIWKEVRSFWEEKITLPPIEDKESLKKCGIRYQREVFKLCEESFKSETYFAPLRLGMGYYAHNGRNYSFPTPTDININMMPFIVGENLKDCKLPDYLQNYWPLIEACLRPQYERRYWHLWPKSKIPSDIGKVYYLTIQESWVEPGNSQRRPGLHVDSPGSAASRSKVKIMTLNTVDWILRVMASLNGIAATDGVSDVPIMLESRMKNLRIGKPNQVCTLCKAVFMLLHQSLTHQGFGIVV